MPALSCRVYTMAVRKMYVERVSAHRYPTSRMAGLEAGQVHDKTRYALKVCTKLPDKAYQMVPTGTSM